MSRAGVRRRVALLEQQPVRLLLPRLRLQPRQHPAAVQLLARQAELERPRRQALLHVVHRRPGAGVPDDHRPAAVLALRDHRPRSRRTPADGPRSAPPAACRPGSSDGPFGTAQLFSTSPDLQAQVVVVGASHDACARRSGCRRRRTPRRRAPSSAKSRASRGSPRAAASPCRQATRAALPVQHPGRGGGAQSRVQIVWSIWSPELGIVAPVEPRLHPGLALREVVPRQLHHRPRQRHDRDQVDRRHQPHRGVGGVEHRRHRLQRAPDHHQADDDAQDEEPGRAAHPEIDHRHLRIGVVADDRGEGEEEDRHRDEVGPDPADVAAERRLGELGAGHRAAGHVGVRQQDHQRGGGADRPACR